MTPVENILALLISERDRLNRAIEALQGPTLPKRRGRPPKNPLANAPTWVTTTAAPAPAAKKKRARTFTAEQKAAQAERMRQMWAKRKRASKKKASE